MSGWLIVINESKWRERQPCCVHSRIENLACMINFEASLLYSAIDFGTNSRSVMLQQIRVKAYTFPRSTGEDGVGLIVIHRENWRNVVSLW